MAKLVEVGSGSLRKGVIDSIAVLRGDPFIRKITAITYCREASVNETSTYHFMMDACGLGVIYVRPDLKAEIIALCRELFNVIPEVVVKLDPCNKEWQKNFTVYLKGINSEELMMLKLTVE